MLLAFALALAVLVAACAGPAGAEGPDSHDEGVHTCEPGFGAPSGFRATETFEDPYVDHVGIRLGFVDDEGRELHAFVGIPGEFGEGLPVVGSVEAAGGIQGPLQGSGDTWVLSWSSPGPCGPHAILGTGFSRGVFLDTLERAGIVPTS